MVKAYLLHYYILFWAPSLMQTLIYNKYIILLYTNLDKKFYYVKFSSLLHSFFYKNKLYKNNEGEVGKEKKNKSTTFSG